MRAAVLSGLDKVGMLAPGRGFAEITAGVAKPWQGELDAYVRAELGFRPRDWLDLFGFGQADLRGVQAGAGARLRF